MLNLNFSRTHAQPTKPAEQQAAHKKRPLLLLRVPVVVCIYNIYSEYIIKYYFTTSE